MGTNTVQLQLQYCICYTHFASINGLVSLTTYWSSFHNNLSQNKTHTKTYCNEIMSRFIWVLDEENGLPNYIGQLPPPPNLAFTMCHQCVLHSYQTMHTVNLLFPLRFICKLTVSLLLIEIHVPNGMVPSQANGTQRIYELPISQLMRLLLTT